MYVFSHNVIIIYMTYVSCQGANTVAKNIIRCLFVVTVLPGTLSEETEKHDKQDANIKQPWIVHASKAVAI